ncbi:MAG: hypothetical protein LC104_09035 [Bacteroidales bacterium]|nr:hypothetical protein [Bacteroidales bacterium]
MAMRVLAFAVRSGRISDQDFHRITVHVISPDVAISDHAAETNRLKALFDAKVLSPQTWCQKEGLDPKVEAANWKAWDAQNQDQGQNQGGDSDDGGDGNPPENKAYSESRDGLIKKTITDKNGDKRTVWVRASNQSDRDRPKLDGDGSSVLRAKSRKTPKESLIQGNPTDAQKAMAAQWVSRTPSLPPELVARYTEDLSHAISVLPAGVLTRAMNAIRTSYRGGLAVHQEGRGIRFYETTKDVERACRAITGKNEKGVVGFAHHRGEATDIHIDGGPDPRGTYVHEIWHAADNGNALSRTKEWKSAYKEEVLRGRRGLSPYAAQNEREGFAEFGRVLAERGEEYMIEFYPKCVQFCRDHGLM